VSIIPGCIKKHRQKKKKKIGHHRANPNKKADWQCEIISKAACVRYMYRDTEIRRARENVPTPFPKIPNEPV
jgi:ribonuclease HII